MTPQSPFQEAVAAHQAGRLDEAAGLYERALAAEPGNFRARYQLAFLRYQQQRGEAALEAVEAALAVDPESGEALLLKAVLLLNAGRLDEALASAAAAAAREPGSAEAWHTSGVVLNRLARFDDAVRAFDKVLALQPANSAAHCHRGGALLELRRYPEAVASFDRALEIAPNLFEAWSNRGLALFDLGRFADSLVSYEKAAALRPDFAPVWINRGKALDRLERLDEALASFDRALALAPGSAEALYARALSLRTLHRLEEALADTDRALAREPRSGPLNVLRGWLLCELGRISEGLAVIALTAERTMRPGTAASPPPRPPHQERHDAEQREYLAGLGRPIADGEIRFEGGGRVPGRAVNPDNAADAAAQWARARPRIAVIDNLLTSDALQELRRYCLGSTIWRKPYGGGYLGALPEQGFASPLLAQIAEELRGTFPSIIGDHRLRMLWAFKYDSRLSGIGLHADQAAVNVNFWITPDEANNDPRAGGLTIWDVAAPAHWDVGKYNGDEAAVRAFLKDAGAKPVTVPYRANRAVVFDSDLFHETDRIDFREGYLNRRINVTMLYGRRTHFGR